MLKEKNDLITYFLEKKQQRFTVLESSFFCILTNCNGSIGGILISGRITADTRCVVMQPIGGCCKCELLLMLLLLFGRLLPPPPFRLLFVDVDELSESSDDDDDDSTESLDER